MADVTILLPNVGGGFPSAPDDTVHAVLIGQGSGNTLTGRIEPSATDQAAELGDFSDEYVDIPRPGRTPLLVRKAGRLQERKYTLHLTSGPGASDVEDQIVLLRQIVAGDDARIFFDWGQSDSLYWRVVGCAVKSVFRTPGTNRIRYATADLSLREVSDGFSLAVPGRPPMSVLTSTNSGVNSGGSAQLAALPRTTTVQQGDTLFTVSQRAYGTPTQWRAIGDANSITRPSDLPVGSTLKIP